MNDIELAVAHLDQLCDAEGIDLDPDTRRQIIETSVANGLTDRTTVAAFVASVNEADDQADDLDWDDAIDDGPPDYASMTPQEVNDAMVTRARQLEQPEPEDPERSYDLDNHEDFVAYGVLRMGGMEADDFVDAPDEAA